MDRPSFLCFPLLFAVFACFARIVLRFVPEGDPPGRPYASSCLLYSFSIA